MHHKNLIWGPADWGTVAPSHLKLPLLVYVSVEEEFVNFPVENFPSTCQRWVRCKDLHPLSCAMKNM